MTSPEDWRWIWLAAAVVFTLGEMATAGTFFLLPFAIGAGLAAVLAFAGLALPLEWLVFVLASAAGMAALRPLARRLDAGDPSAGIGARRWIGETGRVLADIPGGRNETGLVRAGREEWRAESADGSPIPAGTPIKVVDVTGTRLVVWPVAAPATGALPEPPPAMAPPAVAPPAIAPPTDAPPTDQPSA